MINLACVLYLIRDLDDSGCCARAANGHAITAPTDERDHVAPCRLIELHLLPLAAVWDFGLA